jgi:L,D-transpeptidase YcbB
MRWPTGAEADQPNTTGPTQVLPSEGAGGAADRGPMLLVPTAARVGRPAALSSSARRDWLQRTAGLACAARGMAAPAWLASLAWLGRQGLRAWAVAPLAAGLTRAAGAATAAATDDTAWVSAGRPTPVAEEALALLQDAASHGLDPADYGAATLADRLGQARVTPLAPPADSLLAADLSAALQRLLEHLRFGRVDPRRVHHGFEPPPRAAFDARAVVAAAVTRQSLAGAVAAAAPPLAVYTRLREALAHYRGLAGDPAWASPLPALPGAARGRAGRLDPGQDWAGVPLLAARLRVLGDLQGAGLATPPDAAGEVDPGRYDGPLVEAVRRFQRRHGLTVDGVVGAATLAALAVTPAARARQIELSLERLRWTPLLQAPRMVVINVPEFVLRAYEVRDGRIVVRRTMNVVVGRARDTRTPLFSEPMRFIEFAPYWNVPPSIARGELVPRLRRDPAHFTLEGFEFVDRAGKVVEGLSAERLDAVLAGRLRLRQRPGPRNALGDIKFIFPNTQHIFLHHTPAVSLFDRDRRDFSHGCIRVEDPVALARFVLEPQPEWTETRIRQAMAAGASRTLRMAEPVPVLIAYGTAVVVDGEMRFFDDLYGYDAVLDRALQAAR